MATLGIGGAFNKNVFFVVSADRSSVKPPRHPGSGAKPEITPADAQAGRLRLKTAKKRTAK